ncbi:unnamed protein product [Cylicocyclus nassatus]|uniref:Uncharacterized protein n=1 Tax=Cylicocyclus nassatus TaxID=53992 RepID=A0AA36MB43_CYLNA|nr:unnamed protein product [Cylicocyclus nassatus]
MLCRHYHEKSPRARLLPHRLTAIFLDRCEFRKETNVDRRHSRLTCAIHAEEQTAFPQYQVILSISCSCLP